MPKPELAIWESGAYLHDFTCDGISDARRPCRANGAAERKDLREQRIMIVGIGTDLVRIGKIADLHRRFGRRFESRIFTEQERSYCLSRPCPELNLAARFAAKEALFKALGTGKTPILRWAEASVERDEVGRPSILASGKTLELLTALRVTRIHVSLTHTDEHAVAFVILESRD